jgi:hypothetical protein
MDREGLEDYWARTIPAPQPSGEGGEGYWITQTLRKGFVELSGDPGDAYDLANQVLHSQPISLDGLLPELPPGDAQRWHYDIPPPFIDIPSSIAVDLNVRYDGLSRREVNLVQSGAELVLRIVQKWLQQDGTPFPPPGFTADMELIRSSAESESLAAHFPINCP